MFACEYCEKKFSKKNNMYRHIKYNCKIAETVNEQNMSKDEAIKQINKKEKEYNCHNCKKSFYSSDSARRHMKNSCKITEIIEEDNISQDEAITKYEKNRKKKNDNICYHCDKIFSNQSSMYRHMKNNCKVTKLIKTEKIQIYHDLKKVQEENEIMKKELMQFKKQLQSIQKKDNSVDNITINNTYNTINNNIIIFSFGQEDISKIKTSEILKALKMGFHSTIKLTDTIHFNPKYPEYHNVYIPSMKEKYAMVYKNDNWELINKHDLVDKIYDNKKEYIEDNMEDFYASISQSQKNALNRWLTYVVSQADENNDEKIKDIKERIKLLLYNKKHIPLNTKKTNNNNK